MRSLSRIIGAALAIALVVVTAMAQAPRASAPQRAGDFVWHDLVTDDPAASRAFYGALFGWTFAPGHGVDPNYLMISQNGYPIGGIVTIEKKQALPQWVSYVMVADVDRATAAFRTSGGQIYRGPLNVRKDLRVSVVGDAQGAPLGLASRGRETPTGQVPDVNRWLWMEYVAVDASAALDFYTRTVGYTSEVMETREGRTYHLLKTDRPRAGLFVTPWKRESSLWLPYVRVEDPAAMAQRVTTLGGTVALAPQPNVRNGSLAIVLDPSGAPLALQKFPFDRQPGTTTP